MKYHQSKASTPIFHIKDLPWETIVPICSYGTSDLTSSESAYDRAEPDYEADSTLVDQPLDLRNEKDPRVFYFFKKKGPGGFEEKRKGRPIDSKSLRKGLISQ